MNEFGERLAELRKIRGLKQKELAAELNISVTILSNYECGHKRPSDEVKKLIARFFNVSLDYFLGITREEYALDRSDVLMLPSDFPACEKPALREFADFLKAKHIK